MRPVHVKHLAVVMMGLGACARGPALGPQPEPFRPEVRAEPHVDHLLGALSTRDKIAQLVVPWVAGTYAAYDGEAFARMAAWVDSLHVGGLLVSVGSPLDIAAKLNRLQERSTLPLLIASDFEGGTSIRFNGGTPLPPNMGVAATGSDSAAYQMGRITALEGRAVGVHLAFAPVADVNNNPDNPIINVRSYGEDPRQVGRMVAAEVRGLQDNGMLATAKHFPGHGDTDQNSHLSITEVNASRPRLDSVELPPFRRAIAAGVGAIMTFHGVVPALDTSPLPATLSPTVMTGLLRHELDFDGLLITDALDMNGVLARVRPSAQATPLTGAYGTIDSPGLAEVVKLAVLAGNDVLLMPLDPTVAIDAVVAGVAEGRFTQARVDSSVRRILLRKHAMGLARDREVDLRAIRNVVGIPAHLAIAEQIAERSITLPKDSQHLVPIPTGSSGPTVLSITISTRADLGAGASFDSELRRQANVRSLWVDATDPAAALARATALADSSQYVVFGSYLGQGTVVANTNVAQPLVDLARAVVERNPNTIFVAFGNPYLYQQIPFAPTYLVAWSGFAPSQRAAARALLGLSDITGRLPISIPPAMRLGDGETRARSSGK
jgi:beta-N-acetylhexosaminidase